MIIDTHTHYDDKSFDGDRDNLIRNLKKNNIEIVVNASFNIESTNSTIELTKKYDNVYGMVGVHPSDTKDMSEKDIEYLRKVCHLPKIAAIGEIGLDYYWDEPDRKLQKKWFEPQLQLSNEEDMPIVIHSRDAAKDTLDIIKQYYRQNTRGIIHCFSYGTEMAREYLNMGFYLGIGGVVTFKNAKKLKEVVAYAPIESIVLETDCPYLTPVPYRGKRNDSRMLSYVVQAIADIKNISASEVIDQTNKNARKVYGVSEIEIR